MGYIKTRLKGGSLSGVYLLESDAKKFVRKEVSLTTSREYGFQRWYSQLKKIQRYNHFFPDLFPKILCYGMIGDTASYDMEYIENAISAHEFVCNTSDNNKIDVFYNKLLDAMKQIHSVTLNSNKETLDLYIREEVIQKLNDSITDPIFNNFIKFNTIIFNGEQVESFYSNLENYQSLFKKVYNSPIETLTHGNITLENLLYDEIKQQVYFIDPYEENIIDSPLTEYSQILQSSNSKYEIYNGLVPKISKNEVSIDFSNNPGLDYFNKIFIKHLRENLNEDQFISVRLFEISQFIRMLPFKKEIDKDKMIFFYALASKLFNDLKIN